MRVCPRCLLSSPDSARVCPNDAAELLLPGEDPLLGRSINSYQVEQLVGYGAMGRVYRARHTFFEQRSYAIKFLQGSDARRERFRREAKVISELAHPNIVGVVDFGTTAEGLVFLVMEWIDGMTLSEARKEPMPIPRVAAITRQIATGLAAAHRAGFVHRDLKPANIMLSYDTASGEERVKILDFGLAKSVRSGEQPLTQAGAVVGTPGYVPPEAIRGLELDALGDLYSLGVNLYQLLTGSLPFARERWADLAVYRGVPPPPPDALGLGPLALALIAFEPMSRPRSAADVVSRIDALGIPPWTPPEPATDRRVTNIPGTASYPAELDVGASSVPPTEVLQAPELGAPSHATAVLPPSLPEPSSPAPSHAPRWGLLVALSASAAALTALLLLRSPPRPRPSTSAVEESAPSPPRPTPIGAVAAATAEAPTARAPAPPPSTTSRPRPRPEAPAKAPAPIPTPEPASRVLAEGLAARALGAELLSDLAPLLPDLAAARAGSSDAAERVLATLDRLGEAAGLRSEAERIRRKLDEAPHAPGIDALSLRYLDLVERARHAAAPAERLAVARGLASIARALNAGP